MPLKRSEIENALEFKGFRRAESDHAFFIYYSQSGKKSPVRTKTSHGTGYKDISDNLVSQMAKQCRLTNKDFKDLVACPLSRQAYEDKLVAQGLVDPPQAN